jgi:excisionase family DNA binding protein
MSAGVGEAFAAVIEQAVEAGVKKALRVSEVTNRRVFSAEEAGIYIGLSRAEIYNMIGTRELRAVKHGKRTMFDVRDLDEWIERNKVNSVA